MKKYLTWILAGVLFAGFAAPANAQGLLGRLAEQAGKAVGGAIGKAVNNKVSDAVEAQIPDEVKDLSEMADGFNPVTGEQVFPPRRYSSFGWDGVVTPSDAKFPIPLMDEFPKVPSASELVNPLEDKQIEYYKAIKRVTLRAEELNADTTCADEETLLWREKTNSALKEAFGLTDADLALMEKENRSEAEDQYLSEKIANAILGGNMNLEELEKEAARMENMSTQEMMGETYSKTEQAVFAVYDAHAAELKKYTGFTAQEYKEAYHLTMTDEKAGSARNKEMSDKMKEFQKAESAKNSAFKKEADSFQKALTQELTRASLGATGSGRAAQSTMNVMGKIQPIMELQQKLTKYHQDILAAFPAQASAADADFSAADRKKLLDIKEKIYGSENAEVYNPLYLEAMALIQSYRERAAKVWVADVQKRFDNVKGAIANVTKINRQAIEDGILPECALYRIPLNMVIDAGDILAEAYSEFPSDYPVMYQEEVVREINLGSGRMPWWPEWSVFGSAYFDDLLAGKYIFASNKEAVFQFQNGSWTRLTDQRVKELSEMKKTAAPDSQTWTSQDGKRKVVYNAEGGFFQLPEGDLAFPDAWKVSDNKIQWIRINTEDAGNGNYKYQIVLCTYKL